MTDPSWRPGTQVIVPAATVTADITGHGCDSAPSSASDHKADSQTLVSVNLLGPLDVLVDRRPVTVSHGRQAVVLAVLAMSAGRPVSMDTLVARVWGSEQPLRPRASLHSVVMRLRRALGAATIVAVPSGYILDIDPERVDAWRFRALISDAAAQDDPQRRRQILNEALELWRDEPLTGIDAAQDLRAGLIEEWLGVIEERIELDLDARRYVDVLVELAQLTAMYPLRERLWAQRMLALYRSGRQAEALECYRLLSRLLAEDLGIDPSPHLGELRDAVLRQDTAFVDAAASRPTGSSIRPRPYPKGNGSAADADIRSDPLVPYQLPPDVADFVGRTTEITALEGLLINGRSVHGPQIAVVAGKPGVGKSAFAIHVAHRLRTGFPDGQLYADVSGTTGRPTPVGVVLTSFLRALGVHAIPEDPDARVALFRSLTANLELLLVLENVTTVSQVRMLVPGGRRCAVMITARGRLAGPPGTHHVNLRILDSSSGIDLLRRMIGAERLAAEPAQAHELVGLCEGLPLALRIAGTRLAIRPHWQIGKLVQRLAHVPRPLDELSCDDLDMRSTLGQSYRALPGPARALLRHLSNITAGDLSAQCAAALMGTTTPDAEELLDCLVDAQLLDVVEPHASGHPRYRMHTLIRAYAQEQMVRRPGFTGELRDGTMPQNRGQFPPTAGPKSPSVAGDRPPSLDVGTPGITVRHDTVLKTHDGGAAMALVTDLGPLADIKIEDNLVGRGIYALQVSAGTGLTDVAGMDNRLSRKIFRNGGTAGPVRGVGPTDSVPLGSGNVWDDTGEPVS